MPDSLNEIANPQHPNYSKALLRLRRKELDELLDQAAERGAERMLTRLGLESEHAAHDIRELRNLLDAWRDARRTVWQTMVKVVTTSLLAAIVIGTAIKLKFLGGGH